MYNNTNIYIVVYKSIWSTRYRLIYSHVLHRTLDIIWDFLILSPHTSAPQVVWNIPERKICDFLRKKNRIKLLWAFSEQESYLIQLWIVSA